MILHGNMHILILVYISYTVYRIDTSMLSYTYVGILSALLVCMKQVQWPVKMIEENQEVIVYIKVLVPNYLIKRYGQIEAIKMYLKVR